MQVKFLSWLFALASLLIITGCTEPDQSDDEKIIRKNISGYVSAFNNRDATSLAGYWSEEAEYVNPVTDETVQGRENIESVFRDLFKEKIKGTLQVDTESITFNEPNVAVEKGTAKVTKKGEEPIVSDYSIVYIKEDGNWLIDSVLEWEITSPEIHYEHLKELEWMLGEWTNKGDDNDVIIATDWDKNKNFILKQFTVNINGKEEQKVTQLIGWDAHEKIFRSWVFDSDGGFGEGEWKKNNDKWYVNTINILPDGRKASSINVYQSLDSNTFTWSSYGRDIDGEILPNVDAVTFIKTKDNNK